MDLREKSLKIHKDNKGKLTTASKVSLNSKEDLSLVYTPGVAEVCREIHSNNNAVYDYTFKSNSVGVITDGSAVLGLGNIGAEAALPVMEGKCIIFKKFANIDAFPICIKTQQTDEIIKIVKEISTVFGGINLEDISAPRCFEIESELQDIGIPVFHDDQHGTAIVILAALRNSAKVLGKELNDLRVVINGAGAAGIATAKLLLCHGVNSKICQKVKDIILIDTEGIIYQGREHLNNFKHDISKITNLEKRKGSLKDALKNSDVFIGVSKGNLLTRDMVKVMSKEPVIFAMANPIPEIMPDEAKKAGAAIVGTGRSDFPNQINNSLAFPGIFRGALDSKSRLINTEMKIAAAIALSNYVKNPTPEQILPSMFDKGIVERISNAVKKSAIETHAIRKN